MFLQDSDVDSYDRSFSTAMHCLCNKRDPDNTILDLVLEKKVIALTHNPPLVLFLFSCSDCFLYEFLTYSR